MKSFEVQLILFFVLEPESRKMLEELLCKMRYLQLLGVVSF